MKEKKLSNVWLLIAYILLALALVSDVYSLIIAQGGQKAACVLEILSVLAAIAYFALGYKKDAAKYFRAVMFLIAGTVVLDYILLAIFPAAADAGSSSYLEIALTLVIYGNFLLLAAGKDLGKKWSYILIIINLAIYLCSLIAIIFAGATTPDELLMPIEWIAMTVVGLIMVKAKYLDKSNRDTK